MKAIAFHCVLACDFRQNERPSMNPPSGSAPTPSMIKTSLKGHMNVKDGIFSFSEAAIRGCHKRTNLSGLFVIVLRLPH